MKGQLLILGISCQCCALLKLKFHSEVVFVCYFGNYFHYGDSVSERKAFGRGLSARAVLSSGSVICCDHLLFAYLWTFHICGVSRGGMGSRRRRNRAGKFRRSHIYSVEWQWFSLLLPQLWDHQSPQGLGTHHCCALTFLEEAVALRSSRFTPCSTGCQISRSPCRQRPPNWEALHFHRLSFDFPHPRLCLPKITV